MFGCPRTATVYSQSYNTYHFIKSSFYFRLVHDFPEYEKCLKQHVVAKYWDPRICFIAEMIKQVEYLEKLPDNILFDLIFSMEIKYFDKDQPVLSKG